MEQLTLNLTTKEYDLITEYQGLYHELFNKHISLEDLFKTALFINYINNDNKTKSSRQTRLGAYNNG